MQITACRERNNEELKTCVFSLCALEKTLHTSDAYRRSAIMRASLHTPLRAGPLPVTAATPLAATPLLMLRDELCCSVTGALAMLPNAITRELMAMHSRYFVQ